MSTVRRVLLPDLDGELFVATEVLDDVLALLATWAEDDPEIGLPAVLDRRAADAVSDIRLAIARTPAVVLYGPDGDYEHQPLRLVDVDEMAVAGFGAAVAALAAVVHGPGAGHLAELVSDIADERRTTPAAIVELAARFHGMLELDWTDDQRLIATRLGTATDTRVVLTDTEEAAYRRLRDRWVAMWHDYDPLARWTY